MKIYTKVVMSMADGAVLEEESYEYEGPLALCGGGGGEVKETAEEREIARIATEQWNDYQTRFIPVENAYMDKARITDEDTDFLQGEAAKAVQGEYSKAEQRLMTQFGLSGAAPGSGKFGAGMAALDAGRGAQLGLSVAQTGEQAKDLHAEGLQSMIAMGRGQAHNAQLGLGQNAALAAGNAINNAANRQYGRAATGQALGTAAGMAARHYMPTGTTTKQTGMGLGVDPVSAYDAGQG